VAIMHLWDMTKRVHDLVATLSREIRRFMSVVNIPFDFTVWHNNKHQVLNSVWLVGCSFKFYTCMSPWVHNFDVH